MTSCRMYIDQSFVKLSKYYFDKRMKPVPRGNHQQADKSAVHTAHTSYLRIITNRNAQTLMVR